MTLAARFARYWCAVLLLLIFSPALGADSQVTPPPVKPEEANAQELMRTYLQLQEQLHATQLAIEQTRSETRASAEASAEALATRLQSIESALASQRARELEAMQSSNRVMLIMAGTFAAIGFAAMLLMAYFQWRTVHGLAEISAALPSARALGPGPTLAALPAPEISTTAAADQSSARLLGILGQLEKRIYGLERSSRPALEPGATAKQANGNGKNHGEEAAPNPHKELLTRGQALLDQDDAAGALAVFEQVLQQAPDHAEALVKKGAALERLGKLPQALECYDQAIAADNGLTVAYLHKGGVFNRMERFTEALECYEKALSTQERLSS